MFCNFKIKKIFFYCDKESIIIKKIYFCYKKINSNGKISCKRCNYFKIIIIIIFDGDFEKKKFNL